MANWYIGIDESGQFDSYRVKNDHSFVCAVVTQKTEKECITLLDDCAREINEDEYLRATSGVPNERKLAAVINNFYHGMDLTSDDTVYVLNHLIPCGKGFFDHVFCSKPHFYVGSKQHYYMTSLQNVLSAVLESGLIQKGDHVSIHVAERIPEVIGNTMATDLVVAHLKDVVDKERKKVTANQTLISQLESTSKLVLQYGGPRQTGVNGEYVSPDYKALLSQERARIQLSVSDFVNSAYPWYSFSVICCSARECSLPALADQAINAIHYQSRLKTDAVLKNVVIARTHKFVRGGDVSAYVEDGDYEGALKVFLDLFYEGNVSEHSLFGPFNRCLPKNRDALWTIAIEFCHLKMDTRGEDGSVIQKTKRLIELLDEAMLRCKPSNRTVLEYLRMKDVYAAHDGANSLGGVERTVAEIKNLRDFSDNYADYQDYCQLYIDEMMGSVAQVRFNNYNFVEDDYRALLNSYKTRFEKEPHFFARHKGFKDDVYSEILGTLGQALMFRGEAKDAISFFELDYEHASKKQNFPASYLVVSYLYIGDFEKAKYWLQLQAKHVLDENKDWTLSEIGEKLDQDMWVTLNYLRLYAFAQKYGITFEAPFPSYNMWERHDAGDYPWALLLKWGALIYLQDNRKEGALKLLDLSIKAMSKSQGFTIKTLLLPILKMQAIATEYKKSGIIDYGQLYNSLIGESECFKEFIKTRSILHPDDRSMNLWLAATALPFNYS